MWRPNQIMMRGQTYHVHSIARILPFLFLSHHSSILLRLTCSRKGKVTQYESPGCRTCAFTLYRLLKEEWDILELTECQSILTNLAVVSSKSCPADTRVVVNVIHAGSTIETSVVNTVVDIFKAKQNADKMHSTDTTDSYPTKK